MVEIMPIAEFSGRRGWGYDGVDLFAPHHGYGGPDGLKRLIDACHARDPKLVRSRDAGGYGVDAAWADDWHHALHAALTGERSGYYADFGSLSVLAKALRQAWVYDGIWSQHRGRVHGRAPCGLSGRQFVVSTQNHDQVGNRAAGERSAVLMSDGRLRIAAALLLTSPFVPMLFQGEEWGAAAPFLYFTDHADPQLARSVSRGRRQEFAGFGWRPEDVPDPQDPATLERSKLDWSEAARESPASLLSWYRELIAWRRRIPALTDPRLDRIETRCDEQGLLSIARGPVLVAVNIGPRDRTVAVDAASKLVAASSATVERRGLQVILPPDTVAILTNEGAA